MKVKLWGVRGSLPTPLTQEMVRAKIDAVVQRMSPQDLENSDSRTRFLANLPSWLYGTVGGNSSCVELTSDEGATIILDAGTGIRSLGKKLIDSGVKTIHLFLSHFHWDHIQGLPFFDPAYRSDTTLHIYSAQENAYELLDMQMQEAFFPVGLSAFTKDMHFHTLSEDETFSIGSVEVQCKKMFHPGDSYSLSFSQNNKSFIYATDVEILHRDFEKNGATEKFFKDASLVLIDAQYTGAEAIEKENWGHSSFCNAIDFASFANVKKILLFHHDPIYTDKKLYAILDSAHWYRDYTGNHDLEIELAVEGMEFSI